MLARTRTVVVTACLAAMVGCSVPTRQAAPGDVPASTSTSASVPLASAPSQPCTIAATIPSASDAPRRRIYLLRHGEADYYGPDGKRVVDTDVVDLTPRGHRQATAAGRWFCAMGVTHFDRVIASNLPRAQQTARDLLDAMGLASVAVETWPALREVDLDHGESADAARARILPALDELRHEHWDTMLIVAHTLVNDAILGDALTGDATLYGRFEQGTGCINVLDAGPGDQEWVVRAVNVCPDPSNYGSRQSLAERLKQWAAAGAR